MPVTFNILVDVRNKSKDERNRVVKEVAEALRSLGAQHVEDLKVLGILIVTFETDAPDLKAKIRGVDNVIAVSREQEISIAEVP